ncbi:MAG TPA: ribosome-associated translation inhibitor RaiA [Sphingobacteriaceae bacterium]|nr:ribosome-associated translation inhibitor RaiA [Sphingobacteriaceae bacterium]
MNIIVSGKNVEVTDALRDYVERKVGRIERYFPNPLTAQVTLSTQRERHIVEVTVPVPADSLLLRAEEDSGDMYASVDAAVEKLERQIRKYKTRINRRARRLNARQLPLVGPDGEEEGDEEPRVVKTKRFSVKPMDTEEAILQMNLLGHDFFVFRDAATHQIHVVYRRKDGHYGLIEPLS